MADDIRRSGRSTKGQHPTKNAEDAIETPKSIKKSKSDKTDKMDKMDKMDKTDKKAAPPADASRSQSAASAEQPPEEEGEDDAIYRCVCGDQREIRGREMIMCDRCEAWQHNKCLGLPDSSYWEDKTYLCEQCAPQDHQELLAAIARGEKPWNRKKGSKAPRPKYRASDVGSQADATPETQTPRQTPGPAHAPAPTPPAATQEAPKAHEPKKVTPKSEPQSPVREKRSHDAVADKEASSSKRRKSSNQHHARASSQAGPAASIDELPEKQKRASEQVVKNLSASIKDASDAGRYRIPDGDTPSSVATRIVLRLDHAAATHFGPPADPHSPYVQQFRSIIFNTKNNPVLLERLLHGSLSPEELASMPVEEMASEDKQKEFAAMKEASERQSILTEETGPRLRKTHKGEEIVGEDDMVVEHNYKPPEPRHRESMDEAKPPKPPSPPAENSVVVELPEDITTERQPISVDTASAQAPNDSIRRPSTNFDINSVFDKVKSPQHDQQPFAPRRQSSIRAQQTPQDGTPVVDADIDRLLKDEDPDVQMGGHNADPTVVWTGALEMASQGSFEAVARFVAGGDLGQFIPWEQMLRAKPREDVQPGSEDTKAGAGESSAPLPILGRIEATKGSGYIEGLASSGAYDVGVLAITPITAEGQIVFDRMYNYFRPRDRWGVVPVDKLQHPAVRDLYVIPVEPGGGPLPGFLNLLEHCTIETPRPVALMLFALVVKTPEEASNTPTLSFDRYPADQIAKGQPVTQQPTTNGSSTTNGSANGTGPIPSPNTNPHAPQYSPMQPNMTPSSNFSMVPPVATSSFGSSSMPAYQPPPSAPMAPLHNGHVQGQAQLPPPHTGFPPAPQPQAQNHGPSAKAVEIFGPYIDCLTVKTICASNVNMSEQQMLNLRHIMDTVPEARVHIAVLAQHLAQQDQQSQGGQPQTRYQPGAAQQS